RAGAGTDAEATHRAALAKLTAVRVATSVCDRLPALLGRGALLHHPLLEKWRRDVGAFEFMEGTGHVQQQHVATGYLRSVAP
ncbi:MAG TPA: acyl-CoA dehydrogenase family protein, partial [Pseudonocardiaceae bacterium]